MIVSRLRVALLLCVLLCAGALGGALAAEHYGGLVPCALCLVERWPYRIGIAIGLVGLLLPRPWARLAAWALLLTLLASVAAASVHVGVEQHWWPSPLPQCQGPDLRGLPIAERLRRLPAGPSVACEDPVRLVAWLPVSIAQLNLGVALAACASLSIFLLRERWRIR